MSFFLLAPLTFAVPLRVFCLFLRCLPVNPNVSINPHFHIAASVYRSRRNGRTLLSGWLLDLVGETDTDESVVWLELLEGLWGVVDEGESSGLSTTELSAETEDVDLVLVGLVKLSKLCTEIVLGDVGAVWVEDVTIMQSQIFLLQKPILPIVPSDANPMPSRRATNSDAAMLISMLVEVHLHNHLLTAQERVADELASAQGHWLLAVCHFCDV